MYMFGAFFSSLLYGLFPLGFSFQSVLEIFMSLMILGCLLLIKSEQDHHLKVRLDGT